VSLTLPILDAGTSITVPRVSLNAVDAEMSAAQVLYQIPKRLIGDRIVGPIIHRFPGGRQGSTGIVTSVRLAIRYLLPIVNQWHIFNSFCQEPSR
jgi:hypothetical protein